MTLSRQQIWIKQKNTRRFNEWNLKYTQRAVRVFAKREKFVIFAWERVIWNVKVVNVSRTSKTASKFFYLYISTRRRFSTLGCFMMNMASKDATYTIFLQKMISD